MSRLAVSRTRVAVPSLDWTLFGATGLILAIGTLLVWSATSSNDVLTGGDPTAYLHKHLVNILIGLVLAAAVMATDHRWVRIVTPLVYVASVIGLLLVLVMGTTINGSRSWLMLGGLSIQPAEFAKLAVVIGMAMIIAERTENSRQRRVGLVDVALLGVLAGIPAVLIILQPDLGTMLVLAATVFGVLAVAGVPRRWLVSLFVSGATVAVPGGVDGPAQAVPDQPVHGLHRSRPSTRAVPATTRPRRGSRSATAACSGRVSSTARRPVRASCPSSTPTSSSPSPARSSA